LKTERMVWMKPPVISSGMTAPVPLGVLEHHAGLRRGMRRLDAFSRLLG
jgi:hypothetical protein